MRYLWYLLIRLVSALALMHTLNITYVGWTHNDFTLEIMFFLVISFCILARITRSLRAA